MEICKPIFDEYKITQINRIFMFTFFLPWKKEYNLQITEIDEQHQKLVNLINLLNNAFHEKNDQVLTKEIIRRLKDYTVYHFKTEEKYFEEFKYKDRIEHIEEHDIFVKKVIEFQEEYNSNPGILSLKILDFLKDWTINHIEGTDRKYIKCFRKNGLK